MCGAIEEVIPPCGTIPPSLFLICIAECMCVCDVKKLYSNRQRSLDALSRPQGGGETQGGGFIFRGLLFI